MNTPLTSWRIWTDPGGLTFADPGSGRSALKAAVEDCAETLSPVGEPPALSTYWVNRLLANLGRSAQGDVGHGNLWVLTVKNAVVEVRMDIDPPSSEPLEVVTVEELVRGLRAVQAEVMVQLAAGHVLDGRYWSQKNPG